jgi:hypothetical protein
LTIIINDTLLLTHSNFAMPLYKSIVACLDKTGIEALAQPATNAALTYHSIASLLPAPWLLNTVSDTNSNNPVLIILVTSEAATEFNHKYKTNAECITSAEDQLEDFVNGAKGVLAGRVPLLNYFAETGNKTLLYHHQQRHYQ